MSERTGAVIGEQTFGETVADAYGVPFCLAADGKWYRADASDPLLSRGDMALCVETSVAAGGIGSLLKYGWIRRTGWTWTLGQPVYFGATPGTLTQTKPVGNTIRYAGYPTAADALWFSPTDPVLAEYLSLDLPTGTRGDLLAHNGVAWAPLAPGTERQVLQTGGPDADPAWADLPDGLYRNAIINGNFDIWQRGTSFTLEAITAYHADRWLSYSSVGSSVTITREPFTPGQTEVPHNPGYYLNMNITAVGTLVTLGTRVEDVRTFAGQVVTLSFYAKSSVPQSGSIYIFQNFGTGGSSQVTTLIGGQTFSETWQRHVVTFAVPSISGKTVGVGSYLGLRIFHGGAVSNISFAQVQPNIGDKPLPFAPRPIAEELALCQRYYRTWTQQTENGRIYVPLWPPMRVAPTMTASAGTTSNITATGFNLTHNAQATTTITASSEL